METPHNSQKQKLWITDHTVSYGVPNEEDIYADNDLPDSFVFKHPAGHSISLSDKNTSERKVNEIKLKSSGNKRLILSDSPAAAGGECITLIDENENQVKITSVGDEAADNNSIKTRATGNLETYTIEGHSEHQVGPESESDYSITNAGKGDIKIKCNNGEIVLQAQVSLTLQCGGSTITLTPEGVDIEAKAVNIKGGTGDVNVAGVGLVTHRHIGNLGAPTSPGRG